MSAEQLAAQEPKVSSSAVVQEQLQRLTEGVPVLEDIDQAREIVEGLTFTEKGAVKGPDSKFVKVDAANELAELSAEENWLLDPKVAEDLNEVVKATDTGELPAGMKRDLNTTKKLQVWEVRKEAKARVDLDASIRQRREDISQAEFAVRQSEARAENEAQQARRATAQEVQARIDAKRAGVNERAERLEARKTGKAAFEDALSSEAKDVEIAKLGLKGDAVERYHKGRQLELEAKQRAEAKAQEVAEARKTEIANAGGGVAGIKKLHEQEAQAAWHERMGVKPKAGENKNTVESTYKTDPTATGMSYAQWLGAGGAAGAKARAEGSQAPTPKSAPSQPAPTQSMPNVATQADPGKEKSNPSDPNEGTQALYVDRFEVLQSEKDPLGAFQNMLTSAKQLIAEGIHSSKEVIESLLEVADSNIDKLVDEQFAKLGHTPNSEERQTQKDKLIAIFREQLSDAPANPGETPAPTGGSKRGGKASPQPAANPAQAGDKAVDPADARKEVDEALKGADKPEPTPEEVKAAQQEYVEALREQGNTIISEAKKILKESGEDSPEFESKLQEFRDLLTEATKKFGYNDEQTDDYISKNMASALSLIRKPEAPAPKAPKVKSEKTDAKDKPADDSKTEEKPKGILARRRDRLDALKKDRPAKPRRHIVKLSKEDAQALSEAEEALEGNPKARSIQQRVDRYDYKTAEKQSDLEAKELAKFEAALADIDKNHTGLDRTRLRKEAMDTTAQKLDNIAEDKPTSERILNDPSLALEWEGPNVSRSQGRHERRKDSKVGKAAKSIVGFVSRSKEEQPTPELTPEKLQQRNDLIAEQNRLNAQITQLEAERATLDATVDADGNNTKEYSANRSAYFTARARLGQVVNSIR